MIDARTEIELAMIARLVAKARTKSEQPKSVETYLDAALMALEEMGKRLTDVDEVGDDLPRAG